MHHREAPEAEGEAAVVAVPHGLLPPATLAEAVRGRGVSFPWRGLPQGFPRTFKTFIGLF